MKSKFTFGKFLLYCFVTCMALSLLVKAFDDGSNLDSHSAPSESSSVVENDNEDISGRESRIKWTTLVDSVSKLKTLKVYKSGRNVYTGLSFKISKRFTCDRYDDTYHYFDAERGQKIIWSDLTITSKSKDPNLHAFGVYYLGNDSSLVLVNVMNYRFYRWEDYGTYLGNYNDNNNDFSYQESVRFSIHTTIEDDLLNKKLFILAKETPTFFRVEKRFDNPPVSYISSEGMLSRISTDVEWENNGYKFITSLN